MTKFGVTSISFLTLAVSAYSVQYPSYYLQLLIDQGIAYAIIRGVLVCMLMAYMLNPALRSGTTKRLFSMLGLVLITGAVFTMISPTLLGHLPGYYPLGDSLIFLELGIWFKVLSVELPVTYREPKPVRIPNFALSWMWRLDLLREWLSTKPRDLLSTASSWRTQASIR